MRIAGLVFVVLLAAVAHPSSAQGTQAFCPDLPEPALFAETETSLENLAFDGNGSLYVSDAGSQRILRFTPDGSSTTHYEGDVHGMVWGPDDRLYTAQTSGEEAWDVLRSTDASVSAFEVYSAGIPTYNGMAFDGEGNLYVSDDSVTPPVMPPDLVRIPRAAPMEWTPWTPLYGPNGLAFDRATGGIYTVITADQSSPVLRISTTDADTSEVVTYLSYGIATLEPGFHDPQGDPLYPEPKGLDDLTIGPDGLLYITAHLSGELLRVDPATGSACLLATGLEEPTSVRVAHGFGPHGGKLFVTTWGGVGVTGIAAGSADMHPAGKLWTFDVGFVEEPGSGTITAPPLANTSSSQAPIDDDSPPVTDNGKDTPLGAIALLALAVVLTLRRR